jgi:Peptidase family S41
LLPRRLALLLVAVSFLVAGCSEDEAEPELSPSEDLRGLVRFLEEVHPRPYESLDAILEDETDRLDDVADPDELATAHAFHRLLAWMDDGHLAVALPMFQPGAAPLSLVPVAFKAIGASFYVDASSAAWPRGTELLAIDGVQIASIWTRLLALTFTNGPNIAARMEIIERNFPRYYPLIYGLRPSHVLSVRFPDGQTADVAVDGLTAAAYAELPRHSAPLRGEPTARRGEPQWPKLTRLDATSVLLRLPDFGIADQAEYARRIDEIFAGLSGADELILDVRGNPGGLRTNGIAVLNHLLSAPYAQWQAMSTRVLRIPDEHRARVDFPYVPEAALAERFADAPKVDGRYVFTGDPLAEKMKPSGPGYPGRVSVFLDSATASAAVEMLVALRASRPDTVFIGEKSATDCGRHIGELPVTYTAPSSGLVVLVSLIELTHVAAAGCLGDGGFFIEVMPSYTVEDFLGGVDPYLVAYARSRLGPVR